MLWQLSIPVGILGLIGVYMVAVLRCDKRDIPEVLRALSFRGSREIRLVSEQGHLDASRPGLDGMPDRVVDGRALSSGPEDGAAHGT